MTKYAIHDGELVSLPWKCALEAMERDVGPINVNEGHRTMARQAWFYMCYRTQSCNNGNLAAVPSPFAPHIRTGRIDHAIDFDDGAKAERWLDTHGIPAWRTVPGENWHVEVDAGALRRFFDDHCGHDKWDTLPKHVEFAVRRLFMHRNQARDQAKPENGGKGPKYRKAVRWRNFWRNRVEGMLQRSRKQSTTRLLRQALDASHKGGH